MFEPVSATFVSLVFATFLFVGYVAARRMILDNKKYHTLIFPNCTSFYYHIEGFQLMKLQSREHKSKYSLMFKFVAVIAVSSIFDTLMFAGFVDVRHMLLEQERSYSNISKTVSFLI